MVGPSDFVPVSGEWLSGGFDIPVQQIAPQLVPQVQATPKPMSIVLPFIERERAQVLRLLAYILKLSGKPLRRTLYLVPFKGLKIDDVLESARAAFETVEVIRDHEGAVSNWKKGDKVRDAAGPNSLFRQAAWHFLLSKPPAGPWLWLEPDCVPLVANWHEAIEAAYRASGKPFMGALMTFAEVGDHLNGVAVYPRDAVSRAPALVTRSTWTNFPDLEIAFDVAGGADVLRQSTVTNLIAFESADGAVLVHGDRDGKLLEKLLSGVPVLADEPKRKIMAAPVPTRDTANGKEARESTRANEVARLQPPAAQNRPRGAAQKSSKRKRGDAKCRVTKTSNGNCTDLPPRKKKPLGSNGAEKFDPEFAPTVGDEIRYHIGALERLASNANRRTRILKGLRKTTLLPRIAR